MASNHYQWIPGEPPPRLRPHSIAKHNVLRAYLEKYVSILAARPMQEQLKLTLVDGFAGGGAYLHPDSNERIPGSPIIMVDAMGSAEAAVNQHRLKKFNLDVEYFFVEKLPPTIEHLRDELNESAQARDKIDRIHILLGGFATHLDSILTRIEQRGRSRRVIFLLDQYGFSDVRMAELRVIFKRLPNAEVILTVATDWLIDYWTGTAQFEKTLMDIGIEIPSSAIAQIKHDHPGDWRHVIQHILHHEFYRNSGAAYYTPFFIFSPDAHRAIWLLHFSGHSKARDVMMELHWELENHFQHFGQQGFCMLGYDPRRDAERSGQSMLPFRFDSFAEDATRHALLDQLPRRIASWRDGVEFQMFFNAVVNETPATKEMIASQISELTREKELKILTSDGRLRRNGVQVQDHDIVVRPKQTILLPPYKAGMK